MDIYFLYKVAKKKSNIINMNKSVPPVDVTGTQINRINNANEMGSNIINKMITPHTDIDAASTYEATKQAQREDLPIDIGMVGNCPGSVYPGTTLNPTYKAEYIKNLLKYMNNRSFNNEIPDETL